MYVLFASGESSVGPLFFRSARLVGYLKNLPLVKRSMLSSSAAAVAATVGITYTAANTINTTTAAAAIAATAAAADGSGAGAGAGVPCADGTLLVGVDVSAVGRGWRGTASQAESDPAGAGRGRAEVDAPTGGKAGKHARTTAAAAVAAPVPRALASVARGTPARPERAETTSQSGTAVIFGWQCRRHWRDEKGSALVSASAACCKLVRFPGEGSKRVGGMPPVFSLCFLGSCFAPLGGCVHWGGRGLRGRGCTCFDCEVGAGDKEGTRVVVPGLVERLG